MWSRSRLLSLSPKNHTKGKKSPVAIDYTPRFIFGGTFVVLQLQQLLLRWLLEEIQLCDPYGIDAIPLSHEKIDEWRDSLRRGITFGIDGSNVVITGGVDDMWVNPQGEYVVVDYKSTAKDGEITLDAD